MILPRGVAVVGLPFALANASGVAVTAGAAVYLVLDGGTQVAAAATPVHKGGGQWVVDLDADETDAAILGVLCTASGALPVHYAIATQTPVVLDEVVPVRTWCASIEGHKAANVVTLATWSSGFVTLAFDFAAVLNPDALLEQVVSVTVAKVSDQSAVATSSVGLQQSRQAVNFDVAAITSTGDYLATATVQTSDGQTLVMRGTLEVV